MLKGGISWRMLPREFAPWKTVYHYFRLWRLAGLWDLIHDQLRDQVRVSKGRHICPSAAIVDSQSVATQGNYRRLARDYEINPRTSEAWIKIAMIHLMVRRLA